MPANGFPVNRELAQLVSHPPKEFYRGTEWKKLKTSLADLQHVCGKLSTETTDISGLIYSQCADLERLIQLTVEERSQEIEKFRQSLMAKVAQYKND